MMVFDESRRSEIVLPRTMEMFEDQGEGMCFTCNEYSVHCGDIQEGWFGELIVEAEWTDLEDWTMSNEDVCGGEWVEGW